MASELKELTDKFMAGLELISSEEADEIIGEAGGDCQVLEEAMDALQKAGWMVMLRHGLRNNKQARELWAKHTIAALQLVHNAYALGKKSGME